MLELLEDPDLAQNILVLVALQAKFLLLQKGLVVLFDGLMKNVKEKGVRKTKKESQKRAK